MHSSLFGRHDGWCHAFQRAWRGLLYFGLQVLRRGVTFNHPTTLSHTTCVLIHAASSRGLSRASSSAEGPSLLLNASSVLQTTLSGQHSQKKQASCLSLSISGSGFGVKARSHAFRSWAEANLTDSADACLPGHDHPHQAR